MSEQGYNGWKNYPTWCVNLWLSNDEALYRETLARAKGAQAAEPYVKDVPGWSLDTAAWLARDLKEWVRNELAPDLGATFAADLLGYAFDEVDWYEIAEAWLSEDFAHDKYEVEA